MTPLVPSAGRERPSIADYAMAIAITAASRSQDPYRQVGAALLRADRTVAALGYNGPPPGVEVDWSDRTGRRLMMVHAEMNALRFVKPGDATFLATTSMPCRTCVLLVASYGIREVLYRDELDPAYYSRDEIVHAAERCKVYLVKWRDPER